MPVCTRREKKGAEIHHVKSFDKPEARLESWKGRDFGPGELCAKCANVNGAAPWQGAKFIKYHPQLDTLTQAAAAYREQKTHIEERCISMVQPVM